MNHSLPRRAFVALQYLVPQHLLSRLFGYLAGSRIPVLKDFLIRRFIAAFAVDMREALDPDPSSYADFNAFFTRALAPGARPLDSAPDSLVSPADGAISQLGRIEAGRIVQAKGHWFSSAELLDDPQLADATWAAEADHHRASAHGHPREFLGADRPCARRRAESHDANGLSHRHGFAEPSNCRRNSKREGPFPRIDPAVPA